MIGLMEVLQRCSSYLSNGKKQFKSIYTMDGSFIKDLDDIPLGVKIVLVSEKPPPKEQEDRLRITKDLDSSSEGDTHHDSILVNA